MLGIKIICLGKMREKHFSQAFEEYRKRLSSSVKLTVEELAEARLGDSPAEKEIASALEREAAAILRAVPNGAYTIALCVEGELWSSEEFAHMMNSCAVGGESRLCFIIGSSFGLADGVKRRCDRKLSLSSMTFPHQLARVLLIEQIYRGVTIIGGGKYNK